MTNTKATAINQSEILKKYYFIFPSAFLMAAGTSLLALGMIFYLKAVFQASAEQVGIYSGLWPVTYLLGCLSLRPLYKRIPSQYLVLIASISMAASTVGLLFATNIQATYVLQLLFGLSIACLWPPLMGWMSAGRDGSKLGNVMSYYNLSWSSGVIAGPFLAGYLSEINVRYSIYISAAIFLTVTLIIMVSLFFVISNDEIAASQQIKATPDKVEDSSTVLRYPAWICVLVGYALISGIMTVVPIYFEDIMLLQKKTIGTLLLTRSIIFSICFIIWAKTSFWHFNPKIIVLNQLGLILLCGIMYMVSGSVAAVVVLIALMSICITMCYSTSLFHGVTGCPNRTLRVTIHESLLSIGMAIGAYTGGLIYDKYSFQMVFAIFGILTFIFLLIQLIMIMTLPVNDACDAHLENVGECD